jgi:hypothetical protein
VQAKYTIKDYKDRQLNTTYLREMGMGYEFKLNQEKGKLSEYYICPLKVKEVDHGKNNVKICNKTTLIYTNEIKNAMSIQTMKKCNVNKN